MSSINAAVASPLDALLHSATPEPSRNTMLESGATQFATVLLSALAPARATERPTEAKASDTDARATRETDDVETERAFATTVDRVMRSANASSERENEETGDETNQTDSTAAPDDQPVRTAPMAGGLMISNEAAALSSAAAPGAPAAVETRVSLVAAAANPMAVVRDPGLLDPELQARLDRVIDRMSSEYGHHVEIVETFRSQVRQDALFEQGRSEPGRVVTWTHDSKHTLGRAVDVVIDGTYDATAAYARLAQVAAEEGLRTLGARDPGHIELPAQPAAPTNRLAPNEATPAPARALAMASPVGQVGQVGQVAQVAQVAQIAQVAQVAQVGRVTRTATKPVDDARRETIVSESPLTIAATSRTTSTASPVAAIGGAQPGQDADRSIHGDTGKHGTRQDSTGGERRGEAQAGAEQASNEVVRAMAGSDGTAPNAGAHATTRGAGTVSHSDAAERIARMLKLQDAGGADRTLAQIVLRIEHPDGGEDRIRIDRRGTGIGAALQMNDSATADRLTSHIGELQRALERQGLEAESLSIRSTAKITDLAAITQAAAAVDKDIHRATTTTPQGSGSAGRERSGSGARQDERPGSDPQRQRSRKEQRGER